MSQPKNYGPNESDPYAKPLKKIDQLIELFHKTERAKEDFQIGIEYEMFGHIKNTLSPLPYEGFTSITRLFAHLAKKTAENPDPFVALYEDENIVALNCKRAVIALEPGGQIEVAAKPHRHLYDVVSIFSDVVKDIKEAASELGISLFALGIHPYASQEDMAKVKKARYLIMRNYMKDVAGLGLDMMTRSCAIQLNLDFADEKDMVSKARLAAALVPFCSLICSSSAFIDKKPATYAVERANIWRQTDRARTGIPSIIFAEDFSYASWINMVLDVPMYFIRRDSAYINVAGASFKEFMTHGLEGQQATIRDFIDHMSTVFTEIRLKPILELRSCDSLPVPFANALTALVWALFYDQKCHQQAWSIFADISHHELMVLHNAVIDMGRKAYFRGQTVFSVIDKLLNIAQIALDDLAAKSNKKELASLLGPFITLIEKDITCAEWISNHFNELNESNLNILIKNFDPFNNPIL